MHVCLVYLLLFLRLVWYALVIFVTPASHLHMGIGCGTYLISMQPGALLHTHCVFPCSVLFNHISSILVVCCVFLPCSFLLVT